MNKLNKQDEQSLEFLSLKLGYLSQYEGILNGL